MLLLALLLSAASQETSPEVRVMAAGRPNAQTPATLMVEPAAMLIVACDSDGDGRTTRAELDACLARSFGNNALGYIDYGRWQTVWLGDQGALPSPFEVDRDGDNKVTLTEVQAQFSKLFSRYDRDGDKAVTRAEALTVRVTASGGRSGDRGGPPRGKSDGKPRGERIPGGKPGQDAPDHQS